MKKLEYLIPEFLTPYISDNYDLYVVLVKGFAKYLDDNYTGKTLKIDDNLYAYKIFPELLDYYLDQIFTQTFDFDVYGLTDDNKKRFIDLAQKINGLKGNKQAFAVFFQTLTNFQLATDTGIVDITDLGEILFSEPPEPDKVYTYIFKTGSTATDIDQLIKNVHPAGMGFSVVGAVYDATYTYDATIDYKGQVI